MEHFLPVIVEIAQLLVFISGGIWIVSSMKSVQETQSERLKAIEQEVSELRKVVVSIARQEERMNALDQRLLTQSRRIDCITYASRTPKEENS
jgi:uncharacterized membrane protein affecting hemolysin expression